MRALGELAEVVLLAVVLYLVLHTVVIVAKVEGPSMLPTLDGGDLLLTSRVPFLWGGPQRGDIVILQSPFDASQDYVKRVVGRPGDTLYVVRNTVCLRSSTGSDGHALAEPYVSYPVNPPQTLPPVRLAPGQVYVMGDNRANSSDSRRFGPVGLGTLRGDAFWRIWPLDRFGPLGSTVAVQPNSCAPPVGSVATTAWVGPVVHSVARP